MSYTPPNCVYGWNTTFMSTMIKNHATSPSAYLWGGAVLVSTYAGEGYGNQFFADLKSELASEGVTISLAPALTSYTWAAQNTDPKAEAAGMFQNYTAIDGFFNCMLLAFRLTTKTRYLMNQFRANLACGHENEPHRRR